MWGGSEPADKISYEFAEKKNVGERVFTMAAGTLMGLDEQLNIFMKG